LAPCIGLRRRAELPELLDGPLQADAELAGNLRDLARINRWSGGVLLLHAAIRCLTDPLPERRFSLLDVGGGDGAGLSGVLSWAARRHLSCRGIVLDRSRAVLQLADRRRGPEVRLLLGDACHLPLGDQSVDLVSCSLVLHHVSAAPAQLMLREMARVARVGVIVDDLLRSHVGLLAAWAMGHLLTSNRLTRHDAPLSVRRAFRPADLTPLLVGAGLQPIWQRTIPGYRSVLAARPAPAAWP
jgi:hypothetical protein